MEMTFYDDNNAFRGPKNPSGKALKRPVTLDFESPDSMSKKQKFAAILTSPDLHMLKLASPELERFIIANGNITTTPTPTQFMFSKNATEEQENYARGFLDALNQLHQMQGGDMVTFGANTSSGNDLGSFLTNTVSQRSPYSALPSYSVSQGSSTTTSVIKSAKTSPQKSLLVVRPPSVDNNTSNSSMSNTSSMMTMEPMSAMIKEELQTVPSDFSSPPLSPIHGKVSMDPETQERIKLERKRYRNRLAASKCRKRKLEKIATLEDKVKDLKSENSSLESMVDRLREQVCSLKQEVMNHVNKGCQIMLSREQMT